MFLPEFDREYLDAKHLPFEQRTADGLNGLVLTNFALPRGKYNVNTADLLIIIPPGYPDVHPDMFYLHPTVLLAPSNAYPRATEAVIAFDGKQWQRWSRHLNSAEWRVGIDGIHTYIQKVITALEIAS
jgi:hypothetical protein